jgi:uncharacterized protein (TIGR02246 family)
MMATGSGQVASAIQALIDEFVRNFNAKNADQLVQAYYAEDAQLLPPNYPIVSGRSQIREFMHGSFQAGLSGLSLETVHVDASGDLAYRVGKYTLEIRPPTGEPMRDTGKTMEVYRRQADGSWKAVADMFSSDQAAPSG